MPETTSRLFSWLNTWHSDELQGSLVEIFIADAAGEPMRRVEQCACEPGKGLLGDRYATLRGHWIKTDGCEVTLIAAEDVERANRKGVVSFRDGEHRRNLVVSGIPLQACRRNPIRIGEVLFAFHRLRPPCAYLDRLLRPGAGRALGKGAGIGLKVLSSGEIRVGDPVMVLPHQPPGRP